MEVLYEMSVETIGVGASVVLLILFCKTLWKRRKIVISRVAPEAAGAWPFIGHLPMLSHSHTTLPYQKLGAMADKYGPAFTIRLGIHKALVVSSSEIAKECFTTNDKVFATRPSSIAVKIMGYTYAMFGFGPYGSYWREARKLAILELLSNHRLQLLKDVRIYEVRMSITELYQIWGYKCKESYEPALVDLKQWFDDLTLNVIVRMVVGHRLEDGDERRELQRAVKDFFHLVGSFVVADAIPWLGWLDFKGHVKAMKRTSKEMDRKLNAWLQEHRENGSKTEQDFMYTLLSVLGDDKISQYESDVAIKAICLNMIVAAFDATTVTLTWTLSLLLNNRHCLQKAKDEISKKIGNDRQIEESDIEKLVYLQAILKETLRLYPPGPLSAQHEAIEDCTVAGYHIPAGTRLITNLSKIQRDPRIWSNPNEFQPERFLTSQVNVDVKGQSFELIPFGSGRRSCPGISFALQLVHLVLARLLQGFDFETPADAPVDMTGSAGLINIKATPLEVLITPCLRQNLY